MRVPSAGQVLGGKYRLVRHLGKGGLAAVWLAEHLTLRSPVALKIIDPISGEDEDALTRFMREARAAAALRSPHVVQILDYGVDADVPFMVMELLEGESLEQRLIRRQRLGVPEVVRIVKHVARAMSRAHEAGITHRDLKPANIFIVPNDDEEIVKVLDFGVAKATAIALGASLEVGPTPAGALLGTPHYMSPEQAMGARTLDHRTDLWSIGIIAYECLVGSVPFGGHSLGSVLTAICTRALPVPSESAIVPSGFDDWFARACAREPSERFVSAKQLADELGRVCDATEALPVRSQPPTTSQPPATSKRTAVGIAPVQLSTAPALAAGRRPMPIRPLVDDEPSGFLVGFVRYKVQLMVAAVVAFAVAATLLEAQKRRQSRSPEPPAVAAPGVRSASAPLPLELDEAEPFSGLGRRTGPVPESAKVILSASAAPAPSPAAPAPAAPTEKPAAAFEPSAAPAAVPVSTKVATTANASTSATVSRAARPAAIKATAEPASPREDTSCDPPYFVDAAGIRRVKPRCL